MNQNDVQQIRSAILAAALRHVPFDGWTWETVIAAAVEAGHDAGMAQAVFPERLTGVLDAFSAWADDRMMDALAGVDPQSMRTRDRVEIALTRRFEVLQPYKDSVRQAAAYWAMPLRKMRALQVVWRTSDRIWDWAGDTAEDYNRYTKRGLLSAIMAATMLVWLDDRSPDMAPTREFLCRRIDNVMQIGKLMAKAPLPGARSKKHG